VVAGERAERAAALAVCRADGSFFLFGCDSDWQVITDTWHESVQAAKQQAHFEYDVLEEDWAEAG
jgi:hypothetical protein